MLSLAAKIIIDFSIDWVIIQAGKICFYHNLIASQYLGPDSIYIAIPQEMWLYKYCSLILLIKS